MSHLITCNPIRSSIVGFVALFALTGVAEAGQRVCGERAKLTKHLSGKYKENPRAIGLTAGGKTMLEIFTSSEGTWTVLMTTAKGLTCIMGAGHSWEDRDMAQYLPKS